MNILFYCSEYPPFPTGGIGSVTKVIAEELVNRYNYNIYVVGYYTNTFNLPLYSEINGVKVYRLHKTYRDGFYRKIIFKILTKIHMSKVIIKSELSYTEKFIEGLILRNKIDILELPDYYSFNNIDCKLNFKKFSIPTILRIHGSVSFINKLKGFSSDIIQQNDQAHFNRCDYLSAVSEYSLNYVNENFNVSHFKRKTVIYNPIADAFLKQNIASDSKTILFIGKLTETKGCYSLLKAFNLCANQFPEFELRLIGKGDIKKAESFVESEIRERVKFLGFCDKKKIKEEIDRCAFACIPTYFENFSIVALEIMARQKALIFTNRTSGREIIEDGVDGFLVNPEDVSQITMKIDTLISNTALRNSMAEKAYKRIKTNFTTSIILKNIIDFYNEIISQ